MLAVVDWLPAACRRGAGVVELAAVASVLILASLVAGLAVSVLAPLAAAVSPWLGRSRYLAPGLVAVFLAWPLLAAPGVPLAASARPALLGCSLVVAAVAFVGGLRFTAPGALLVGAVGASLLLRAASNSLRLPSRILVSHTFFALYVGVVAAAVVMAFALGWLLRAASGERPPRGVPAVAALVGVGLAWTCRAYVPLQYATVAVVLGTCALFLLSLALHALSLRRGLLAVVAAMAAVALAGAGYLAVKLPISPLPSFLSKETRLARGVAQVMGLFTVGYQAVEEKLLARQEAVAGRGIHARAVQWNRCEPAVPHPADASVLLVTIDALRYDHTGYSGLAPAGLTPALDRVASGAQRFHRAYASGGFTAISLSSLFWSRYPKDLELRRLLVDGDTHFYLEEEFPEGALLVGIQYSPLEERAPTLAAVLTGAGFRTMAVPNDGHTTLLDPHLGLTRGFARVIYPRAELYPPDQAAFATVDDEQTGDLAVVALAEQGPDPFFLWVHLFSPHAPDEPSPLGGDFEGYAAEIHRADHQVGRLLDALRDSGREQSTIVVIAGDHGEVLEPGSGHHHGLDLREESVRVPLLVRVPWLAPADFDDEVALLDVAPTLLCLLGQDVPETMYGFSLHRWMSGARDERPPVFLETWYVEIGSRPTVHLVGAVHQRRKLVIDLELATLSYHDLEADPDERWNLLGPDPDADDWQRLGAYLVGWYSTGAREFPAAPASAFP